MWIVKTKSSPYLEARWDHPDGSGRVVSRSTKCVAVRQAEARGRELEAEFRREWELAQAGAHTPASRVIAQYWETEGSRLKSANSHVWPHIARIATFLGERPYSEVTIATVAEFVDSLDGTLSNSTINRALSIWRRLHRVAGRKRLYPVQNIEWSELRRQEPEGRHRGITRERIEAIMGHLPEPAREIVAFALATGARRSQILGLTWDRVDLDAGTVTVWRKHKRERAPHEIRLKQSALALLSRRREAALARKSPESEASVFDTVNFRKLWDAAVAKTGGGVRFHDLRHTVAREAVKRNIAAAQDLLGHSDVRVTMRYGSARPEDVRQMVEELPDYGDTRKLTRQSTAVARPFRVRLRPFRRRTKAPDAI